MTACKKSLSLFVAEVWAGKLVESFNQIFDEWAHCVLRVGKYRISVSRVKLSFSVLVEC